MKIRGFTYFLTAILLFTLWVYYTPEIRAKFEDTVNEARKQIEHIDIEFSTDKLIISDENSPFNINGIDYTIENVSSLLKEAYWIEDAFRLDNDNILLVYNDYNLPIIRNTIAVFNIKNKTYEELLDYDRLDYGRAIRLQDGRISFLRNKTVIFNPETEDVKYNNNQISDGNFFIVQKDSDKLLSLEFGYPDFIRVLEIDINTRLYKEINRIKMPGGLFLKKHIMLDDNRILSYATGGSCRNHDIMLYLYDIKKNRYKKLRKINGIGFNSISAQKLKNGKILFAGAINECTKAFEEENIKYINSIIYDPDKNRIVKKVKMLYKPIFDYNRPLFIPLKTGDLLVFEEGHIRQYFDIKSMKFKPLNKDIILKTTGSQKITVVDEDTIIISQGFIAKKYAGIKNTQHVYILRTGKKISDEKN